jgi:hypothetical protein
MGIVFSSAPVMAATVTQLNITGGSINLNLGLLGSVSGNFTQNGTLVMGSFQPPPDIFPPVTVDGHTFSIFSQSSGLFPAPSGETSGTAINADLTSLFAGISGPLFSGSLNIGGLAFGSYDPLTGAFSLSWTHVYDIASAGFSLEGTADVAPVPLPAAIGLFATGLLGVIRVARRRMA